MATFEWTLTDAGTYAFDPEEDQLVFGGGISAASVAFARDAEHATFTHDGKTVTLQTPPFSITTTNVTFEDGSLLVVGDNTTAVPDSPTSGADQDANTLIGGPGDDQLIGGDDDDTLEGLAGDDSIHGFFGADTIVYADSPGPVIAYLHVLGGITVNGITVQPSRVWDGYGSTDVINTISNVVGSGHDDFLVGGVGTTLLEGGLGNDTLAGSPGGDDVSDTLRGGEGEDFLLAGSGADSLDGGPGGDRLSFIYTGVSYGGTTGVEVNLGAGTADEDTSDPGNALATLASVERVNGTAGDDRLIGGSLSRGAFGTLIETFRGLGGDDTIDGVTGDDPALGPQGMLDRVEYINATGSINVNLATGIATDGQGGTDQLVGINSVRAGGFADRLKGGGSTHAYEQFEGGGGNDTINGGAGIDEANYQFSESGATVNLATGLAVDGHGGTDTLISIERVRGSAFSDTLIGSNGGEVFIGDFGNDVINGGGGVDFASWEYAALEAGGVNAFIASGAGKVTFQGADTLASIEGLGGTHSGDTLRGGTGNQWFRGHGGSDVLNGGAGADTADYSRDPGAIVANLRASALTVGDIEVAAGKVYDGWGGLFDLQGYDTLASVENVLGSSYDDLIIGGAAANRLTGGAGMDTMNGGAANDTVNGGEGNDSLSGGTTGTDRLNGEAGDDILIWGAGDILNGGAGTDTLRILSGNVNLTSTANPNNRLLGIEDIDLLQGAHKLTLNRSDVLAMSPTDTVRILGDAGDMVDIAGAFVLGAEVDGYRTYTLGVGAKLLIDTDIQVI